MKAGKLLYLHGFNSSPQSHKAQLITRYMAEKHKLPLLLCPQIPPVPLQARIFLEHLVERTLLTHELSFVGSSLGGYYATYLAEKYSAPAVLINPSVKPYETLAAYLGENRFYSSDEVWNFDESHIRQLQEMNVDSISNPQCYMVLLQTGDETLDYREAAEKYKYSQCIIEAGGDHGFTGLERFMPEIMQFCRIQCD